MKRRILVTGGAGYLGAVLVERLLSAGHSVVVLDNLTYRQPSLLHLCGHSGLEFVRGDARDEELVKSLVKRVDVIVPLAAIVGAPACDRDPGLAETVNLGAIRMLDRVRSDDQLVVFPTTNSGYGSRSGDEVCDEDSPLDPISAYGRQKVAAERLLLDRPNTITLRLATVFGASPRMRIDLLVNDFVYRAVTDKYLVLFEPHFRRNFVHIRDVADGIAFCIDNAERLVGRPYNLGLDAANLSKIDLARRIAEYVPAFDIRTSDRGSDPDKRDYIVSSARLAAAGFVAQRSLELGIVELIKAYALLGTSPWRNA